MSRKSTLLLFTFLSLLLLGVTVSLATETPKTVTPKTEGQFDWYDATQWEPEGRGWSDTLSYFDRLPAKAEKTVRPPVWTLSHTSTGMIVRFATDATVIKVRYKLASDRLGMSHMPATSCSGVDLYVKHEGQWRWLGIARPESQEVERTLIWKISKKRREYMLYLPLRNRPDSLEIGVQKGSKFEPIAPSKKKPIVFYGTSIVHGGCVSRPGMTHSAILGRRLDCPIINLGFAGNGTMDPSVAELMTELDAAVYVIDCLPNLNHKQVTERTVPLVKILRKARPDVPIVLVEDRTFSNAFMDNSRHFRNETNREALRKAYIDLTMVEGIKGIYYIEGNQLLGSDSEGTVDGSHPTDLGMWRQANAMEPLLRKLLKKESSK